MMPANNSLAAWLSSQPEARRTRLLGNLSNREAAKLLYNWSFWARPNQLPPPGTWLVWLLLAGRGFGKTRTGAEWVRHEVETGRRGRLALVAPTAADARDVMIEGESGILRVSPNSFRPHYEPSKRRLTWPNGALATAFSADEPDRLRGPQHDGAWAEELAVWRYPEAWDMLMFGLRLGQEPRAVVTTTPKPVKLIRDLLQGKATTVTRGTTYENRANLARSFFEQIVAQYEGTRLGRQELLAELLEDVPGALWKREAIERLRVVKRPQLVRVVVGVDPAASSGAVSAETGILAAGLGADGHGYVLDDLSLRGSPGAWAAAVVTGYYKFTADRVIAEVNNGGDMVESTVRTVDPTVSYKAVHASRGKQTRAEPVAALYEQGKVHHVGVFADLEEQMCSWVPSDAKSPDRMDALVWALTELMLLKPEVAWAGSSRVTKADEIFG